MKLVDPDGREIWIKTDRYDSNAPRVKWTANGLYNEDGSKYNGDNEFVLQTAMALNAIYSDDDSQKLLSQFMGNSEYDIEISKYNETYYDESTAALNGMSFLQHIQPISYNPTQGLAQCKSDAENEEYSAPYISLLHEFGHAYNATTDNKSYHERESTKTGDAYGDCEEKFVIQHYEHPVAAKRGMLQRTSHIRGHDGLRIIRTSGPLSSNPIN